MIAIETARAPVASPSPPPRRTSGLACGAPARSAGALRPQDRPCATNRPAMDHAPETGWNAATGLPEATTAISA